FPSSSTRDKPPAPTSPTPAPIHQGAVSAQLTGLGVIVCVCDVVCVGRGSPCPSIPATNTVQPRSGDADGTRPDISQDASLGGFTPNAMVDTWVYWVTELRRVALPASRRDFEAITRLWPCSRRPALNSF